MQAKLRHLLVTLDQATELSTLQDTIVQLRDHFGVAHMVYHWVSADGEQYGCGTYPPSWVRHYLQQDYLRIDPVVLGCYRRFQPVDWKDLDWSSRAARAFRRDALAFGLGNQGLSVPIRGRHGQFALFTASHSCDDATWEAFAEQNRRDLILIAHYFNQKALEFEPGRAPEPSRSLSPREVDAMTLLAIGYSRAQVAETLSISEHTLRVYVESARFKLGAMNTTHAVARALSQGLIVV